MGLALAGSELVVGVGNAGSERPGDVVRLLRLVLEEIAVADAPQAVGAGVAVAVAATELHRRLRRNPHEALSGARVGQADVGEHVGDRLTRRGDAGPRAVGVHAVPPLVVEYRGDLAGVPAGAGVGIEVDRGAIPEGVASARDVHASGELILQPEVPRELSAGLLLQAVDLVEAAPARARVAEDRRGRRRGDERAVRAGMGIGRGVAGDAQVECVAGRRHHRRRAAGVEHLDVLAVELHGHRAVHADRRVTAAVGRHLASGQHFREVGEGHREVGLLDALGIAVVVLHRQHGADHAAPRGVMVGVAESQDLAGVRVHQTLPASQAAAEARRQDPHEAIGESAVAREGHQLEPRRAQVGARRVGRQVRGERGDGDVRWHRGLHRGRSVGPVAQAEEDEVAAVDDGADVGVADRDARDHPTGMDLHQRPAVVHGDARARLELGRVDVEVGRVVGHELVKRLACSGGAGAGQQRLTQDDGAPASGAGVPEGSSGLYVEPGERRDVGGAQVDGRRQAGCAESLGGDSLARRRQDGVQRRAQSHEAERGCEHRLGERDPDHDVTPLDWVRGRGWSTPSPTRCRDSGAPVIRRTAQER